jgi:hypothetical protein
MRRYRARQRRGEIPVTHLFTVDEVATLHALDYLRDCELEDRAAIDAAISALLANIRQR